jgi:sugar phosphate isomerase/epimerase
MGMIDASDGKQMPQAREVIVIHTQHTISVITDEVSPRLDDGIAFAVAEGLTTVDMRSIGGVNFLSLDRAEQERAARQIKDAGLKVGCLATPIFKWPAPGKAVASAGDQFGFDRKGRSDDDVYRDAFEAAALLGTRDLRIFTLLTYDGFALKDLQPEFQKLLELAERHDAVLHVENEPVCNVMSVADLVDLMQAWKHARLRALLDIGNAWWISKPPSEDDLVAVMPYVSQMHIKDYSVESKRPVALGEGTIPYDRLLRTCLGALGIRAITLTIETHVPGDPANATRKSLAALGGHLKQFGVLGVDDGGPRPCTSMWPVDGLRPAR